MIVQIIIKKRYNLFMNAVRAYSISLQIELERFKLKLNCIGLCFLCVTSKLRFCE